MGNVDPGIEKQLPPKGPALDEQTFEKLRERITEVSGIHLDNDGNSRYVLERRLLPRLRTRGLTEFSEYELSLDEKELDAMLDLVAVHETYFFREKRQLKIFSDEILPEIASPETPLKIWSAGCSTGEEAYTVAMLIAERRLLEEGRVELVASDLSHRVIESALQGIYANSSFRTTDSYFQKKYFVENGHGLWRASESLRSRVYFEQSNLIGLAKRASAISNDGFDVIFCRNVLMYFDVAAAKETLKALYSMLKKGGYLLLGHAESLLPLGSEFQTVQFGREIAHRK